MFCNAVVATFCVLGAVALVPVPVVPAEALPVVVRAWVDADVVRLAVPPPTVLLPNRPFVEVACALAAATQPIDEANKTTTTLADHLAMTTPPTRLETGILSIGVIVRTKATFRQNARRAR